ncbi:MAG: hypothetical protein AAGC56_05550, partial [Pseudomonadota bacterium]
AAAEHGVTEPAVGLALDGYGLGADGASSWGGELLRLEGATFARLGALAPLAQPGGDAAARAPWRMGAAALHALGRGDEIAAWFAEEPGAATIAAMLARGVNAPETSSAGRLFDAACGLLGVMPHAAYEGQAPMALEALADAPMSIGRDGWSIADGILDLSGLLDALRTCGPRHGANVFHGTFAAALAEWVSCAAPDARRVLASGGCFQNRVLTERLSDALAACGVDLLAPRQAPANDGGLSLGQAWVAALDRGDLENGEDDVSRPAG